MFNNNDDDDNNNVFTTPKKRTNILLDHSSKRRRISQTSLDFSWYNDSPRSEKKLVTADRFVPSRPKHSWSLTSSPRSNRLARALSLTSSKVLQFSPPSPTPSSSSPVSHLLRRSASELFKTPKIANPLSAKAHLSIRQQCVLALDAPGIPEDAFHNPISWSEDDKIAVVCDNAVYYQQMETKQISRLCRLSDAYGSIQAIAWAGQHLYVGTSAGAIHMWTIGITGRVWLSHDPGASAVVSISTCKDWLAAGRENGKISIFKDRVLVETLRGHKRPVYGLTWSPDGQYLGSGDEGGVVYVWENQSTFKRSARMVHQGPVKALGFCPWSPHLLATGSAFPEGIIRVYNILKDVFPSRLPVPSHVVPLNTSVLTLIWCPHVKELLACLGTSFVPPRSVLKEGEQQEETTIMPDMVPIPSSDLTNALAVFAYPSFDRIATVTRSHQGVVSHACLSPSGGSVFTVCPTEEAMKLWRVWGDTSTKGERKRAFEMCSLR